MNPALPRPVCTDDVARLLPWRVNGTLSERDARRVAEHLEQCDICRDEVAELGRLRQHLRAPAQVEHAPHAGLQRLMARVDAAERRDAFAPAVARETRGKRAVARWLPAVVVVQALALAVLGTALLWRPPAASPAADFRTLSTARAEPAALRVVFAPATTLGELQELLRANGLVVVAGPSEAGIVTLNLRRAEAGSQARLDVLARLRSDPRVRFAEPVGEESTGTR